MKEKAYQDDDQAWLGGEEENFTISEPDRMVIILFPKILIVNFVTAHIKNFKLFLQSQLSSPEPGSFAMKSAMDEMEYIDVEGVHPSEFSSPSKMRKKVKKESATLEEGTTSYSSSGLLYDD